MIEDKREKPIFGDAVPMRVSVTNERERGRERERNSESESKV